MEIYLATSNKHKVFEFSEMFAKAGIDCNVHPASDAFGFEPPEEDGETFEQNAFIKADALRAKVPADAYVMADDSSANNLLAKMSIFSKQLKQDSCRR